MSNNKNKNVQYAEDILAREKATTEGYKEWYNETKGKDVWEHLLGPRHCSSSVKS